MRFRPSKTPLALWLILTVASRLPLHRIGIVLQVPPLDRVMVAVRQGFGTDRDLNLVPTFFEQVGDDTRNFAPADAANGATEEFCLVRFAFDQGSPAVQSERLP